jgi:predicted nucleic acid-binding protein
MKALILNSTPIFISSISIYEVYLGIVSNLYLKGGRPSKVSILLDAYKKFLLNCMVLDFTLEAGQKSAEIYAQSQGKGMTIKEKDCLIAGIALVHGVEEVITLDKADFQKINEITGLKFSSY